MPDLTWVFDDKPVSVAVKRNWPMAIYSGPFRKHACYILNSKDESFDEQALKTGRHAPLGVVIIRYNLPRDITNQGSRQFLNDRTFKTFRELVEFVTTFLAGHYDWQPRIQ